MKYEVYRCNVCGKIILKDARTKDMPVCCGQPMERLSSNTSDTVSKEKHVPVINTNGTSVYVMVGSVPHPMEENHYISYIMLTTNKSAYVTKLDYTSDPYALFELDRDEVVENAYAYCNVHGLWSMK